MRYFLQFEGCDELVLFAVLFLMRRMVCDVYIPCETSIIQIKYYSRLVPRERVK